MSTALTNITAAYKEYYAQGIFSDLTIVCGGREFKVHKVVVYAQSPIFKKLLTGRFKEATEDSGTLTVDDDTEVFAALISYCYHFTYDDSARGEHTSVQTHTVHVYALADKYDTPQLQQLAAQKFKKVCNPVTDIDDFIAALCAVESSTNPADTTLWSIITPCIKTNVTMVLQSEEFKAVVDSMPSLKWSLMAMLDPAPKHEDPHKPNLPAIKRFDDHDEVDSEDNQPRRRGHWRSGGHRLG